MALFTDGPISDAADLQEYENAILNVASTEGIDLGSKIRLAQQELAQELLLFLYRRAPRRDSPLVTRTSRGVKDVVVTDSLRQWHAHKSLALVYRDAYYNQLNDRYQGKWSEYELLAKGSQQKCFQIGVGLVAEPVPKACPPVLSTVAGVAAGGMFYVATTWVSGSGQEGAASDTAQLTTLDGQELVVATTDAPSIAAGWNVYVGTSPGALSLQNQSPLAINSSWTMTGLISGSPPAKGQQATWFVVDQRVIERG